MNTVVQLNLFQRVRQISFLPLFISTLLVMVVLNLVGAPLTTSIAPAGIVSYELAGSVEKTTAIINSWDLYAQLHAAFSLGLDFLFILLYVLTIIFACSWAGERISVAYWPMARSAKIVGAGVLVAGISDIVENANLIKLLFGPISAPYPQIAAICAVIKFLLVGIGLLYTIYGGMAWLWNLRKRSRR
jgi:hypothetical protein